MELAGLEHFFGTPGHFSLPALFGGSGGKPVPKTMKLVVEGRGVVMVSMSDVEGSCAIFVGPEPTVCRN